MRTIAYLMLPAAIRRAVKPDRAGAFLLGEVENGQFIPRYIGRSDRCLQTRLLTHEHLYECSYFVFCYASSPEEAFLTECKWWHDYKTKRGMLLNKIHPGVPSGQKLSCPYCHFARGMKALLTLPAVG